MHAEEIVKDHWDKMAEAYGPSGRFFVKPQLSVFGPAA